VKRRNDNPLDNLFENSQFTGNDEALLDHQFVKLMQEVSLLRNLYSRAKIRYFYIEKVLNERIESLMKDKSKE